MHYTISEDVVWIPGIDEVRLYDSATGEFQTLNNTAAEIWLLVAEDQDVDTVVGAMVDRHTDGSATQAELVSSDIRGFLVELAARGVLVEQSPALPE